MADEKNLFAQATQHFKNKEFDQAVRAFQEVIRAAPNEEAFCGLGLVYTFQNRFEDARKAFEQALQINPTNRTAQSALEKVNKQQAEFQTLTTFFRSHRVSPASSDLPFTSLVMITYNQLYYTRLCIESLLAYTDVPFELILIDNASTDGTGAYFLQLEKDRTRLSPLLKTVRVLLNSENKGFVKAVNQGLRQAKGQILGILNNDLLFTPRWLSLMLEQMKKNAYDVLGPVCNKAEDVLQIPQVVDVSYTDPSSMLSYLQNSRQTIETRAADWIAGFCLLFRRELLDKIGLLDERFGLGFCEDEDYCYRARLAGFKVGYCTVFIHHYWHKSFSQLDGNREQKRAGENLHYLLTKMIRLNPSDAQAHYRLADHLLLERQDAVAEQHYRTCLHLQPNHPEALYNLGVLCYKTNRGSEAKTLFQKLLTLQPDHVEAKKAIQLL